MPFLDRFRRGSSQHQHSAEDLAQLDETAPGWRAIDRALDAIHAGIEPARHWGTIVRWRMGGPDPLDGISAYRVDEPPHWHYVSYGLTELYRKESDDRDVSGWGFELTFRLARTINDVEPPLWPANMLQNLARYVFKSGNILSPGDHTDMHGPIALDEPGTAIRAALFVEDPELSPIDTTHGRVAFTQLVGITLDEYEAAQDWDTDRIAALLGEGNPLLITDLHRKSALDDPDKRDLVTAGIQRDGSSMSGLMVDILSVTATDASLVIRTGAIGVQRILRLVNGRLGHDRSFWIRGPSAAVAFQRGQSLAWHTSDDGVHVTLSPSDIDEVVGHVRAERGRYALGPDERLVFEVETTIVRDQEDREIGRIG